MTTITPCTSTLLHTFGRRLVPLALVTVVAGASVVASGAGPVDARAASDCPGQVVRDGTTYVGVKVDDLSGRLTRRTVQVGGLAGGTVSVDVTVLGADVDFTATPAAGSGGAPLPVLYCLKASNRDTGVLGPSARGTTDGLIENAHGVPHDISHLYVYAAQSTSGPDPAAVRVAKTVDDPSPRVGDTVVYTLAVANDGPAEARDVVVTDVLPAGVTFVSAEAPCARGGSAVRCELGALAPGAHRTLRVTVTVDAPPTLGGDHHHGLDVQKTEVHVDVPAAQRVTGTVACLPGYLVTDGSGRVDHVDQGTGTRADVWVVESRAEGEGAWRADFRSTATGRAQAKVFAVCVQRTTEQVAGHAHDLTVDQGGAVRTVTLPPGLTDVTLACEADRLPVRPGWSLLGDARVVASHPAGSAGWTFGVANPGQAAAATLFLGCLDGRLSTAAGHSHRLGFGEVARTVTVPAGQASEHTLTCAGDGKGIVAGHDLDPGLVPLGNDPRPLTRAFTILNPTDQPLRARLFLRCLETRTSGGVVPGGRIVNTATVATTSPEASTADNSASATVLVEPAVTVLAPRVEVRTSAVVTSVRCVTSGARCRGTAALVAPPTPGRGAEVGAGTLLARATYSLEDGRSSALRLRPTRAGRRLLATGLRAATLCVGDWSWSVAVGR